MISFNTTAFNITTDFSIPNTIQIFKPLSLFIIGVVIYSIFIFKFYRFLGKKNIFNLDLVQYNVTEHAFLKKCFTIIMYVIEYLILFPLFTFFWFAVITLLLMFLSKNLDLNNILLVSITLVSAIRITSYYKQALSMDLAKMMPFAMLGVFLIDISYFSLEKFMDLFKQLPNYANILFSYMIFVVALEFTLRLIYFILKPIREEYPDDDE